MEVGNKRGPEMKIYLVSYSHLGKEGSIGLSGFGNRSVGLKDPEAMNYSYILKMQQQIAEELHLQSVIILSISEINA